MNTDEIYGSLGAGAGERKDCVARAFAVAGCMEYADAIEILAKHGRKPKRGTAWTTLVNAIAELFPTAVMKAGNRVLLSQFVREHPAGHFLVRVRGHLLAVCDGVVHDWAYHPRYRVLQYWQVC